MYDDLLRESFAFYAQAIELEEAKHFLRAPQVGAKLTATEQQKIRDTIDLILDSADLANPRFDLFVEGMLRFRSLYHRFDPINFHPALTKSFFDDDDQYMWDWLAHIKKRIDHLKHQGKTYMPSEDDVKGLRFVVYDLNNAKQQNQLFSSPEEWENYLSLEGESPDE